MTHASVMYGAHIVGICGGETKNDNISSIKSGTQIWDKNNEDIETSMNIVFKIGAWYFRLSQLLKIVDF